MDEHIALIRWNNIRTTLSFVGFLAEREFLPDYCATTDSRQALCVRQYVFVGLCFRVTIIFVRLLGA